MGDNPLPQSDVIILINDCPASVNSGNLGYISVDLTDENHECALLHAVKGAHKEVAMFLVEEAGASLEVENRHCETIIEWTKNMKLSKNKGF